MKKGKLITPEGKDHARILAKTARDSAEELILELDREAADFAGRGHLNVAHGLKSLAVDAYIISAAITCGKIKTAQDAAESMIGNAQVSLREAYDDELEDAEEAFLGVIGKGLKIARWLR